MEDSKAENEDSYIEIELDSSCALVMAPTLCSIPEVENDDKIDEDEDEEELRISISSRIALPNDVDDDVDEQFCVVNFSEKMVDPLASSYSGQLPSLLRQINSTDSDQGRVKLAAFNVENGSLSDHNSSHITLQTIMPLNSCHDMGLHSPTRHSRGNEGSMRRRNGGMIMKMLIKFRGIKLSTLISSLIKPPSPRPPSCQDNNNNNKGHTRKYCRTILQCYHQKNMVVNPSVSSSQEDRSSSTSKRLSKSYWDFNNNINNISSNEGSFRSNRRSSWNRSMVEIDLGSLKGMFSAVGISQKGKSSNKRKSCSTMSSCDNSPIHEGFSITCTTDNSVQAAIAYCKTSSGQTSDFSF